MAGPDVLITGETSKLPPEVAALLDPTKPVPFNVVFFEKRYDLADMTQRLIIAIVIALIAVVVMPFGIYEVFFYRPPVTVYSHIDYWPLGFGLVCAFAAWMMLMSIFKCWGLRNQQLAGKPTRHGTFLTTDALVQQSESDTTIIPPEHFRGIDGRTVKYFHNNAEKSYTLPATLMNGTPEQLQEAIKTWSEERVKSEG